MLGFVAEGYTVSVQPFYICTNLTLPTGNLDSKNSQEIMNLLRESNEKFHQTLIMITHDENIALQADRIIAIEDGKIVRDEVNRA